MLENNKVVINELDYEKKSELENDLILLIKTNKDIKFGEIYIYKHSFNNKTYLVKKRIINNKKEAGKIILDLKLNIDINHDNLMNLVDYSTTVDKGWCSNSYIIKEYYDYFENDLGKEYKSKKNDNKTFSDQEIENILKQISDALVYLHGKNTSHGNIQPKFIFYDNFENYKLIKILNNTKETIALQMKNIVYSNKELFMSPEIFKNLIKKNMDFEFDKYKSDSFSLGLTLVEFICMNSVNDIYNFKTGDIEVDTLNNYLEITKKNLNNNNKLYNIIEKLVNLDEKDRLDFNEISKLLKINNIGLKQPSNKLIYKKSGSIRENIKYGEPKVYKYYLDNLGNKVEINDTHKFDKSEYQLKDTTKKEDKVLSIRQFKMDESGKRVLISQKTFDEANLEEQVQISNKYILNNNDNNENNYFTLKNSCNGNQNHNDNQSPLVVENNNNDLSVENNPLLDINNNNQNPLLEENNNQNPLLEENNNQNPLLENNNQNPLLDENNNKDIIENKEEIINENQETDGKTKKRKKDKKKKKTKKLKKDKKTIEIDDKEITVDPTNAGSESKLEENLDDDNNDDKELEIEKKKEAMKKKKKKKNKKKTKIINEDKPDVEEN